MLQLKSAMPHYDKYFDSELDALRERVRGLGELVIKQVSAATIALLERDISLARATIANDHLVNKIEVGIEEDCIEMLALRQPVGADLRFVTSAIKIVDNLERMGDLAANICERAVEMEEMPHTDRYVYIRKAGALCKTMIRDSLTAFTERDIALAERVCVQDKEMDMLTEMNLHLLLTAMTENPCAISRLTRKMFIAKYLEQIASRARTVAELVIYMVGGKKVGKPA